MRHHIYEHLVQALQAHWKAHANAYPQKFVLSPEQLKVLDEARDALGVAITGKSVPRGSPFMDVPIEVSAASVGEMIAHDGTSSPLDEYRLHGAGKN
ncbi:hypothetical protein [Acidovorax sp. FG27]|uniref:hypothetical protein n=1 Tax=Acidovorax sp. FG27 TaxID=3133652 RepID=UPI0030E9D625